MTLLAPSDQIYTRQRQSVAVLALLPHISLSSSTAPVALISLQ